MDTVDGETTYTNWFQREGNAFKSMCCGIICIPILVVMIFANEINLVKAQATADVISTATVTPDCKPLPGNMGALVFAACHVNAPDIANRLPTPLRPFVETFHGASLSYSVEIYQWQETSSKDCQKDNTGGETCHTTYSYDQGWQGGPINSRGFRASYGHENVGRLPSNMQSSNSFAVPPHSIVLSSSSGPVAEAKGFVLDETLQGQLPLHTVTPSRGAGGGATWQPESGSYFLSSEMLQPDGDYLVTYYGSPAVGDLRVSITGQSAATASICAKQVPYGGNEASLAAWPPQVFDIWGRVTYKLEELREGLMTKGELKAQIKSENSMLAILLRIACFFLMMMAFNCIFQPLSVAADLLRFLNYCTCCLGSILDQAAQSVICCVSCSSACWCFTLTFVLAWMFANPTYGIIGLVVIVALTVAGCVAGQKSKKAEGRGVSVQTPYVSWVKLAPGAGCSTNEARVLPI